MTEPPKDLRLWRLPRGRHGLPRELVERSQRERLLAAIVRVSAAKGYAATSVADILEEAGVGRESFYELFDDKQACMLAARELLVEDLADKVRAAFEGDGGWAERMRGALSATLDWFAADPVAGRVLMLELAGMGPVSRQVFRAEFGRFTRIVDAGLDGEGPPPEVPRATVLAVGAVFARLYDEVARGRTEELPARLPELTYEVLVPFVGEAAAREQQRLAGGL